MIVVAIIGLIAAIGAPALRQFLPRYERNRFFSDLNQLVGLAWQNAIAERKTHKVYFDFEKNNVKVEMASGQKDVKGQEIFKPMKGKYFTTTIDWPENLLVRNFYIEGTDEAKSKRMWFFIVPDGLSQAIVINLIDQQEEKETGPKKIGLVLNPFLAEFKIYDEFQKP